MVESLHSQWAMSSTFDSPEEMDFYFAQLQVLKEKGGMARAEMERLAQEALEMWRNDNDLPF